MVGVCKALPKQKLRCYSAKPLGAKAKHKAHGLEDFRLCGSEHIISWSTKATQVGPEVGKHNMIKERKPSILPQSNAPNSSRSQTESSNSEQLDNPWSHVTELLQR